MANRDILLIEPAYKNKYPPLGLMKIATYHNSLKDNVVFYKGLSPELRAEKWDKIYITTLFSFYWNETIKTIKYYKRSVNKIKDFHIGGIMASMMPDAIEKEVGIRPFIGLLDKPAKSLGLGKSNIVIDGITPDYDILKQIDYQYPANDAYIGYMTRGCVNKCSFCSVPNLEPKYKEYIPIKEQIKKVKERYGEKRHLLLMDNNVLGSKQFDRIIDDIKDLGFKKGASYQPENKFEFYYKRISKSPDDNTAKKHLQFIINDFLKKRLLRFKEAFKVFQKMVHEYSLLEIENSNFSQNLLNAYPTISPIIEKYRNKAKRARYVDFNQGVDARLLTKEKMKRIAELNIHPLRIAFDDIKLQKQYIKTIEYAAQYGIKNLSNYILFNHKDTPLELYKRLKINIDLNERLGLSIYSFPMKYIPINAKNRKYIAEEYGWSHKYIRAIQAILNVTKGAVMPGRSFFERAFGGNETEFMKILIMPENYIQNRKQSEELGLTQRWEESVASLKKKKKEYQKTIEIIFANNFSNLNLSDYKRESASVLQHYIKTS